MLVNENTKELPEQNPELKYQCLILLDEFTSMGKSKLLKKVLALPLVLTCDSLLFCRTKGRVKKMICMALTVGKRSLKTRL